MNLKTGGRNSTVILNPLRKDPIFFSEDKLDNFIANTGISLNQMEKVTNFIRTTAGRNSVPTYYRDHASKKAKTLEDVYHGEIHDFDIEKVPDKEKRSVIYADASELLDAVLEARKQHDEVVIKLMADGGKGFFKISMAVLPKDFCEEMPDDEKRVTKEVHIERVAIWERN